MAKGKDTVISFLFEFNDGSGNEEMTTPNATHYFLESGQFAVQVTTTDQENNTESYDRFIKVTSQ